MWTVRNPAGNWLLPEANWYHDNPTFTNNPSMGAQFSEAQADIYLALPKMPAGAYKEQLPA